MSQIFLSILLTCLVSASAHGAILFSPSVSYMEQKLDDNALPTQEVKLTLLDFRLGYVFDMGLLLGGLYSIHDYNLLADSSDSYFGPSIGYYRSGFLIVGTYYVYGERDLSAGGVKYAEVSGYQIDLSYSIPITETFHLGPQLTYHNISFDEIQDNNGIGTSTDYGFRGLSPYFNLSFYFK